MDGITEKNGVPYIWDVPCIRDTDYKFSSAELLGLTEWMCPHCLEHLSFEGEGILCLKGCHLTKNINRKSVFMKSYQRK